MRAFLTEFNVMGDTFLSFLLNIFIIARKCWVLARNSAELARKGVKLARK